jgi:hypothetical protein
MRQGKGRWRIGRPSPAMVVALIALSAVLGPSAIAAVKSHLAKNSVGSRQIKAQAVTSGKIANNAVTGAKVAGHSLTGSDIDIAKLGTVPTATNAEHAASSDSLGGHAAACPSATTLIRGVCYDDSSTGPVSSVTAAADACAAKGGQLPSPLALYAARSVLNLGSGIGDDHTYTDTIYSSPGHGEYRTIVVDGTGEISESELTTPGRYICAYPLVR